MKSTWVCALPCFAGFLGCHALMTVNHVTSGLSDTISLGKCSRYSLLLDGYKPLQIQVEYDSSNQYWRINAGNAIGRYKGMIQKWGDDKYWASITIDDMEMRRIADVLPEWELPFLTSLYVNVVMKKEIGQYSLEILQRNVAISRGMHISDIVVDSLLLPEVDAKLISLKRIGCLIPIE